MRLVYLSCDFGVPVQGNHGKSVHVTEISRGLRVQGHEVLVVSPNPGTRSLADGVPDLQHAPLRGFAAETVRLLKRDVQDVAAHLAKELPRIVYAEHVQRLLEPELRAFRPDVILERYSLFGYAGVELARALDIPLLLELNAPLHLEAARHRGLVLRNTARELEHRILASADAIIAVSNEIAAYARASGAAAERVSVLPNGVDPDRFDSSISGEKVRAHYGLDGDFVVGFVGSLKPWHDLDTLLEASRHASQDGRTRVLIVGEGPRLTELQALRDPAIICAGSVERHRVPEFLAAMDAVVIPYSGDDSYFSPLKLYEALAMARPVIGARVGQVDETLTAPGIGLTYEPLDAVDLARKIREVRELPDRGAAIGAAARRWVIEHRTWAGNARQIETIARCAMEMRRAS